MKKILLAYLLLPISFLACNSGQNKDSEDQADSMNKAKNDTTQTQADTTRSTAGTMTVDDATAKFLVNVADVNMTEVQLGQIAKDKATNQRVKDFADMMVKDHSSATDELKNLAASKNVTLPTSISNEHQKKMDDLNKKSG